MGIKIFQDTSMNRPNNMHRFSCCGAFDPSCQLSTTERERERERERDEINKNLTCFVGARTGQSISGDSAGLWPFLGAAHKTFTEGEA